MEIHGGCAWSASVYVCDDRVLGCSCSSAGEVAAFEVALLV